MRRILGISAYYHDSAAALTEGGKVIAAAQEERFNRLKNSSVFPREAIRYCLKEGGWKIDDLDAVVFYDKPFLKFERLLESYYAFSPKGIHSFMTSIPIWLRDKLFLKKLIRDGLKGIESYDKKNLNLLFSEHHISHASSTFFTSNFKDSAILTIDGVGEWSTASIGFGDNNKITISKELHFPHSVGLFYSSFTYFLGFKVNSGEYKLMGLAPYGNPNSFRTQRFIEVIKSNLIIIYDDGSIWLDQSFFNYAVGLSMVNERKWEKLFGFPKREPDSIISAEHCDLALAAQIITEEIVLKMAAHVRSVYNSNNLCLAGGVALNCVANGKIIRSGIFENVFIQPASGDAGGSIGAALAANYLHFKEDRLIDKKKSNFSCYLGPEFSDKEVRITNKRVQVSPDKYDSFDDLCKFVARKIAEGYVIGWFQGRMEFGPRALGNRSILADAGNVLMQKTLNLKIKFREGFRPFAPSVLEEDRQHYFGLLVESPYMLLVDYISPNFRKPLPNNYLDLNLDEKLEIVRSDLPAITHVDFSARIQSVKKEDNLRYWTLINHYKKLTGVGVLINTSFNIRDEPIVCTPADAFRCFMISDMDYLVVNDYIYSKKDLVKDTIFSKSI